MSIKLGIESLWLVDRASYYNLGWFPTCCTKFLFIYFLNFPLRLDYVRSPHAYVNQRLQIKLELLMMSGMPIETCWAFNKRWNDEFCYKVVSCWLFLLSYLFICNTFIKIFYMFRALPCSSSGGLPRNCIHVFILVYLSCLFSIANIPI